MTAYGPCKPIAVMFNEELVRNPFRVGIGTQHATNADPRRRPPDPDSPA